MVAILWTLIYLALGIVVSRVSTSRFPDANVSKTQAFWLIVMWPVFLAYLAVTLMINFIGALGGGR